MLKTQLTTPDALCGKPAAMECGNTGMHAAIDKWSDKVCTKAGKPALIRVERQVA